MPPLAKPGLPLKRGSKTDADPSEGTQLSLPAALTGGSSLGAELGLNWPPAGIGFTVRLIPDSMC